MKRNCAATILSLFLTFGSLHAQDPLPSWNDTAPRKAIIDFVEKVTKEGSPDFIPASERIATFDNDGTLWAEQPEYFQGFFIVGEVHALASKYPEWKDKEPFASVLKGNPKKAFGGGMKAVQELLMATHANMTSDEFAADVSKWMSAASHPKLGRPFNECIYQPMLELLDYLRAKGFKTFIVSGGGVEFMRTFAEKTYGIPPEQVIGSSIKARFELRDGKPVIVKEAAIDFVDDGPGKPVGIAGYIGRRPVMAFGNSDGDFQMLQYTTGSPGPRFAMIIHHTDNEREYAYDRDSHIGKLDKALDAAPVNGWIVVDMKNDWKAVFPPLRR